MAAMRSLLALLAASFALACQLADFLLAQADLPDQTPDDAKYLETGWPVTSW